MLGVLQTWINTQVGQRVMHTLRTTSSPTYRAVTRVLHPHQGRRSPVAHHQRRRRHETVVTWTATSIACNVTVTVATAVAMVVLSWRLSLISLVVLPPAIWLTRSVARMRREITSAQQRELADLNVTIEEGSRSAASSSPRRWEPDRPWSAGSASPPPG